ncbi:hypothetical protein ACQE32_06885 [Pantoea sp. FN0302]|uniref:hypothetical protein n=1 Tax=Pantoea sp. FN0302 TaxID=3418558 RepID=UPI003CEA32C8
MKKLWARIRSAKFLSSSVKFIKSDCYFALKKPCANCPFLKEGGIELNEGRLDGIKSDLIKNSFASFACHKTIYPTGGEHSECGEFYYASGKESHCTGATAFYWLMACLSLAFSSGQIKPSDYDEAIEPIDTAVPL